ncbi:MAG: putative bifunctional diguanylate cyclase/phosphodiesterase [Janthinobacterium lividum]
MSGLRRQEKLIVNRWRKVSWAKATLALIAVAAVGLWVTSLETSDLTQAQYDTMTSVQRYDRAWFASRADHEFGRLEVAVSEAAAGIGKPEDVVRWVDVMRNRIVLMTDLDAKWQQDDSAVIADTRRALDHVEAQADRLKDPDVMRSVNSELHAIDKRISGYAAKQHNDGVVRDHADAQRLIELYYAFKASMDRLLICCALLLACLVWYVRLLARSREAKAALASNLSQTVQTLDERQRTLDATLDNMAQGLMVLDSNARVTVSNKRLNVMFGIPFGDMVGRLGHVVLSESPTLARALDGGRLLDGGQHETDIDTELSTSAIGRPMPNGGTVVTIEDVTERHQAASRIAYLAHHDDLTGLANRHAMNEYMAEVIAAQGTVSIAAIDLDGFKQVNDGFGHGAGDEVLREVARRILVAVGADGFVARTGGDEFSVIVAASGPTVVAVAERILKATCAPIQLLDGGTAEIGASIGIAGHPLDGPTVKEVLRNADLALYQAKADGKRVVRVYDRNRGAALKERRALEADLHHAVRRDELVLHYQDIVRAHDRKVCMREALVRWHHPVLGLIPPNRFIPIAEENGEILTIGEWVLHHACADAAAWESAVGISVNLSPRQFRGGAIVDQIKDALEHSGLAASRLELEITETSLLVDDAVALRTLRQIQDLGVRMSMDDFGTGYSSLSYLRRFPFNKIKIDQTFVHEIDKPESAAIIASMTSLARELHVTTTAEGVETEAQAQALLAMNCDQFQGWLFGRPQLIAPKPAFPRLVEANR